ncbi:hypothetical protein TorRG33x02_152290 [Trema orientale]|uniref:Uncharacterized protein n=1 Tax=Trema orientale TaxID=63057 RepID=A0A2P5ETX3_TREOI|nr:hypothetical protein TorRG33x02_152290 [Trema orientale]
MEYEPRKKMNSIARLVSSRTRMDPGREEVEGERKSTEDNYFRDGDNELERSSIECSVFIVQTLPVSLFFSPAATHSESLSRHSRQSPVVVSLGQNLVDALGRHSTLKLRSPLGQHLPPSRLSAARASSPSLSRAKLSSLGRTHPSSFSPRLKASSSTPIPLQVESQEP